MTIQEFTERTGETPTASKFDYIHRVYIACGDLDKDKFCEVYNEDPSHIYGIIVNTLLVEVETLKYAVDALSKQVDKEIENRIESEQRMADWLIIQAEKWSASDLREKAIEILGVREFLRRKLEMGFDLWKLDKDALAEILKTDNNE